MLASGLYKGPGTWSGYSSSAEKCRDQRSSSHTVQHWRKVLGPPAEIPCYVHGQGTSLGSGPCTIEITSTTRPSPKGRNSYLLTIDAVPFVLFSEKDKGLYHLVICHYKQKEYELFLKDVTSPSSHCTHLCSPFFTLTFFSPFVHTLFLECRHFSMEKKIEEGKAFGKGDAGKECKH